MATVTSKLTLSSTDLLSQTLNLSVTNAITASGQVTLHTAADFAAPAYLYVKNTDTTSTDHVVIYDATTSGNPIILLLKGGEFAFMPLNNSIDLKAYAVTSGTVVEFMVFGTEA